MSDSHDLGALLSQTINSEDTLCLIEFSDGSDTNDFIPTEILEDAGIDLVAWWTLEAGSDYASIVEGKKKAMRVTPIKKH